ncbi:MAG: hypothetical protein ACE5GX_04395 [Thermoanaerobaculia bacterium]
MSDVEALLEAIDAGTTSPLYLVGGDRVVSEPAGMRLAERLAEIGGVQAEVRKRPDDLAGLLADLRTFSLFASGKVIVAVDTALLADRTAAASLIDEAARVLPLAAPGSETDLSTGERAAARRLFQALRLFQLDPYGGSTTEVLGELPDWALAGGKTLRRNRPRGRAKKEIGKLRENLSDLVAAGRAAEIQGASDDAVAGMSDLLQTGLPDGHFLVLVESSVAADHPLAKALAERGALLQLSQVTSGRKGWEGLGPLVGELERETGAGIEPPAVVELANRTLRHKSSFARQGEVADAESSARFAAEYRKLATLAGEGPITRQLVKNTIADRGEQDVWSILDAIGAGGPAGAGQALTKLDRYLSAASDRIAARLSFWALLAGFCRHLTAISGAIAARSVPGGESNYRVFKDRIAPELQAELPSGGANPLASLHPYRLHRAYLAASRAGTDQLIDLPRRMAETEELLKGGSSSPDTVLVAFVAEVATSIRA